MQVRLPFDALAALDEGWLSGAALDVEAVPVRP